MLGGKTEVRKHVASSYIGFVAIVQARKEGNPGVLRKLETVLKVGYGAAKEPLKSRPYEEKRRGHGVD